jgi:hypothetical protein
MAYVMFHFDRPTDTKYWNEYNRRVRDWIAQLLAIPGALSFVAYRTADASSPNTTTLLEFTTLEDARRAVTSEQMRSVVDGLRSVGAVAKVCVAERSPFTPEPIRA